MANDEKNMHNIDIPLEDDSQSALEDVVVQTLLVELFATKRAEVFENIVFEGKRRYYIEDLTQRDYTLEHTTPYQLEILGHAIEEHSWGNLLCKTAELLLALFPEYGSNILSFKCPWTKATMFTIEQKTNFKPIKGNLYINCNHTALHSCWFLQDLLDFFKVDKAGVSFLIHRPSGAEPQKVKEYIEQRFKRDFATYLKIVHGKSEENADKVIRLIDKYLNPMLRKISNSYTNFFLFDDNTMLYSYTKKVRENINQNMKFDRKAKSVINRYLDYLVSYYKEN